MLKVKTIFFWYPTMATVTAELRGELSTAKADWLPGQAYARFSGYLCIAANRVHASQIQHRTSTGVNSRRSTGTMFESNRVWLYMASGYGDLLFCCQDVCTSYSQSGRESEYLFA
jgi:hypothetical protein